MIKLRQLKLLPLYKEALDTKKHPRAKPWAGVKLASTRCEYSSEFLGYRTSTGRIYFRCPFHVEKTPSCLWNPRGRTPHFHCFGCGEHGSVHRLVTALRIVARDGYPLPRYYEEMNEEDIPF